MTTDYDVIVVGARCAGSPTAMLMARRGLRVLVVDRNTFPSDTTSTLVIQPPGVAALARWGLLEAVRTSGCPPFDTYRFDLGPFVLSGRPRAHQGVGCAYAPRRLVLDAVLVDAARRAGAEVREGFTLDGLVVENGTVVGIRAHASGGDPQEVRARMVVGADGHHSRVARAVGAGEYRTKPVLAYATYSFWEGLAVDCFDIALRGDRGFAAIPTGGGLTLLLVGYPAMQAAAFRADVEGSYHEALGRLPDWSERLAGATRVERFASGGVPNFFRIPHGPGWALVGDAGYSRDPITGQGITDAFLDAELCAAAVAEGLEPGGRAGEEALAAYHQARDARVDSMYEFTTQLARLEPPPPETAALLAAMVGNQQAMDSFVSVNAGTMSPEELFNPDSVERIMGGLGDSLRPPPPAPPEKAPSPWLQASG